MDLEHGYSELWPSADLEGERILAFERALDQDEHPRDYAAELEDESEDAALTSKKRLKREIQAEAMARLEEAARTEADFTVVIQEWDRLDRNRERRERDHENLRGNVPVEYQAVPDPSILPLWMNTPAFRQLSSGSFLDLLFTCPYELHELPSDPFISGLIQGLSLDQKEILYYLSLKQYSTTAVAAIRGQTDRNIRKLRRTIHRNLQWKLYQHLQQKGHRTLRERQFLAEYTALLAEQGKDAVIRRENTTK